MAAESVAMLDFRHQVTVLVVKASTAVAELLAGNLVHR